jgi:cytochrome P450
MTATRTAPGPRGAPLVGSAFEFRRDALGFLCRARESYGDVVRFRIGSYYIYLLAHPDSIRDLLITYNRNVVQGRGHQRAKVMLGEGLLTSEGDFHMRQRRLAQPAFHRQRIAAYGETMVEYAGRANERWTDGETIDVAREMMRVTLTIAAKTLYDSDVESEAEEIGRVVSTFMDWWRTLMLPFSEAFDGLPLPGARRFARARERLDKTIFRLIEERRASGEDRGDLLSMLLASRDTEGDGGHMTDGQLRDELVTLLLAGHETTANALSWTWYLLAHDPEAESKLHAEIDEALGGRLPSLDDLPNLPYTERVLTESMRLYPPAWGLGRRAVREFDTGGFTIPADSILFACPYVTQRDARWFSDPLRFDPDRWTPDFKATLPRFAYFPFGGGPRQCIGEHFAWLEGVLLLATFAQKWRMRLAPNQKIEMQPSITLRPKNGIRMILTER